MPEESIKVFFSYSHWDEEFKDELVKHLSILQRQGVISGWNDRMIVPGAEWDREIEAYLSSADIILLMVSVDFLDSNYCWGIEVKKAMQRHEAEEACVIPVVLRWVNWKNTPFAKLQALPKNAKPIKSWADQDEAFYNVAEGIRMAVSQLQQKRSQQQPSSSQDLQSSLKASSSELPTKMGAEDFFALALEKQDKEDHQGAIADYDQAIKLNPDHADAYNGRGNARSALGDIKGAIADYDQAIKLNPDHADAYNNRGVDRSIFLGDKKGAIADFQQAADLYQKQGDTTKWRQDALDQIKRLQS